MADKHTPTDEVLAWCSQLNFTAIAQLLEGYGYDDPEGTPRRLRELEEAMRELRKANHV